MASYTNVTNASLAFPIPGSNKDGVAETVDIRRGETKSLPGDVLKGPQAKAAIDMGLLVEAKSESRRAAASKE